jgi:hypothetical protein
MSTVKSIPPLTIIQGPTLANPDAFNTVSELRRELHRTNRELMEACTSRDEFNSAGQQLMQTLSKILLLHIKGITELTGYLDAYLNERPRLREKLEDELQVAASVQVH